VSIPNYRLPSNIEIGSQFAPAWKNVIQEAIAGNEQRFAKWSKCRAVGNVAYGLLGSSDHTGDFSAIMAIYRAHIGSIYPFRFKDWSDFQCTDENFGTGDASTLTFQLTKTYDPGLILLNSSGRTYVRDITLVAYGTTPTIKVDGTTKTPVSDYTISSAGVVTFASAPANGKAITWTGEFDVPTRFDGNIQFAMKESDIITISSLPIREVIGES
jgi:uncharacterized protein (TIGR02217 family)